MSFQTFIGGGVGRVLEDFGRSNGDLCTVSSGHHIYDFSLIKLQFYSVNVFSVEAALSLGATLMISHKPKMTAKLPKMIFFEVPFAKPWTSFF